MLSLRQEIAGLKAYSPGLSIAEIQKKYGLSKVIKMASNENPLGLPPLAREALMRHATGAFRYPQGGNPRLVEALAARHAVDPATLAVGNGSDEIIDLLIRILAVPGKHNLVCFSPCFSIYPIQGQVCGVEIRRRKLAEDFCFDFDSLLEAVDQNTRLVFVTTPDNPSGYCPPRTAVLRLAQNLAERAPDGLLVIDEAYMDFAGDEKAHSLLTAGILPQNTASLRTFSKCFGLAGLRVGYAVLPKEIADGFWRARLPFSVNSLAEEAALAALRDTEFLAASREAVLSGRAALHAGLEALGCRVWPSEANFLMFRMPEGAPTAAHCFETLLKSGIIIRPLASYGLPDHLRVSVGDPQENRAFLDAMSRICAAAPSGRPS